MSFPTDNLSQADLEASNKTPVYVATAIGSALATGSVILRGIARRIARRKSKAKSSWEDYTIVLALILLYGLDVTTLLSTAKYGLGQHLPAVVHTIALFQKVAIIVLQVSPYLYTNKVKVSLGNITLWLATAAATKASLLLLYYRLFSPCRRFRLATYIVAAIVFCQWFSLTLATIFQCKPVAAFWDRTIQGAECINLPRFTIVSGVLNLMTDVLILCLPIPMVWGLKATNARKVALTGVFLLGGFVCAISIIRISKISDVNYDDPTWRIVDVYVWTVLEDGVGITSACLPTLRPLFGSIFSGASDAENSNKKSSEPTPQRGMNAHFNRLDDEPSYEFANHGSLKGHEDV